MIGKGSVLTVLFAAAVAWTSPPARAQQAAAASPAEKKDLHKMLMDKLDSMNAENRGIFHDDVTGMVAPYFPMGQTMADTKRVLAEQHLGKLHRFMGQNDPGMGTMFVAKSALMSHAYPDVSVVVNFDYEGAREGDMRLTHMRAFLRAENM